MLLRWFTDGNDRSAGRSRSRGRSGRCLAVGGVAVGGCLAALAPSAAAQVIGLPIAVAAARTAAFVRLADVRSCSLSGIASPAVRAGEGRQHRHQPGIRSGIRSGHCPDDLLEQPLFEKEKAHRAPPRAVTAIYPANHLQPYATLYRVTIYFTHEHRVVKCVGSVISGMT